MPGLKYGRKPSKNQSTGKTNQQLESNEIGHMEAGTARNVANRYSSIKTTEDKSSGIAANNNPLRLSYHLTKEKLELHIQDIQAGTVSTQAGIATSHGGPITFQFSINILRFSSINTIINANPGP